jgi:hypothetical protein
LLEFGRCIFWHSHFVESKSHSFEVRDQEKNACLLLFCKNANEKRDWLKDLKSKIKDYQIQRFVQSNSPLLSTSASKSAMNPRLVSARVRFLFLRPFLFIVRVCLRLASTLTNKVLGSSDIRSVNKKETTKNIFAFPPSEKYQLSCLTSRTALLKKFVVQEEEYISNLWIILEV